MNLTYRTAQRSDLPTLVDLLTNDPLGQHREDPSRPLNESYISAFQAIDQDPNNTLLVAELEDQIVGMLQLTYIPYLNHIGSWRCLAECVMIREEFRGRGYGRQLFEHVIKLAKDRGCKMIQLTSDKQRPDAIRFYKNLGFRDSHEGFKLLL